LNSKNVVLAYRIYYSAYLTIGGGGSLFTNPMHIHITDTYLTTQALENLITFMLPLKAVTIFIFASAYLVNLPPNSKNKAFTSGFTNSIK